MARVKKYQWGTFSASGASPQMVNPGNAALKQYTTTSSSTIPTGGLPLSGDISSLVSKGGPKVPAGGGFGKFMGNYGGAIAQAAGTLMPLLMKKPDPNEKPYKKGSKLIKYQEGNENLKLTKLQKRIFEDLDENDNKISNASVKEEPAEKFDLSSFNNEMPDIKRRPTSGNKIEKPERIPANILKKLKNNIKLDRPDNQGERSQLADYIRTYNKEESNKGNLGYIDMDYLERQERQNALMMGDKIEPNVKGKIETLTNKTPLLKLSSTPELPATLKKVPVEKKSRRERRQEDRRMTAMAKAPIIYNESSPVGPSNEELQLGRAREEAKLKGTPFTDSLIKRSMSSQAFKDVTSKKSLEQKYNENKGGYARALKTGKINAKGNLVDPNTGFEYEDLRKKSSGKQTQSTNSNKGGNKPLVKMKEDSWSPKQWQDFLNKRKQEEAQVNKEINYRKNPDLFWKDVQKLRQSTMGKNFDRGQKNKGVQKPTQTPAQIDSAINSIVLPRFKGKNTLHPLGYKSK
jgi:hypothetical protein